MPGHDTTAPPGVRISVVIPHLNQPAFLARCLASLAEGRRQPDEIFVVDNGSDALPEAICAAHPGVTLLLEPEPGPGPARNRGVAASSGDILAFIDADCTADPEWLATAEAEMADPTAQILGGDVRIALVDPPRMTMLEAYESEYAYRMDRYIAREGYTGTGNLVVRRSVFEAVGPFGGLDIAEDRDWGRRATEKGYRISYVHEMRIHHPARPDFAGLFRKWDRHIAHEFAELRGGLAGYAGWGLKMAAMAVSPLAELPRILNSRRLVGARSRVLAFLALLRIRPYRAWRMASVLIGGNARRHSDRWNRA